VSWAAQPGGRIENLGTRKWGNDRKVKKKRSQPESPRGIATIRTGTQVKECSIHRHEGRRMEGQGSVWAKKENMRRGGISGFWLYKDSRAKKGRGGSRTRVRKGGKTSSGISLRDAEIGEKIQCTPASIREYSRKKKKSDIGMGGSFVSFGRKEGGAGQNRDGQPASIRFTQNGVDIRGHKRESADEI